LKFLLNMNLPRQLGRMLEAAGHSWRHAGDIGLRKAEDVVVVAAAKASQEVIVTHDLDYGTLLAFSGEVTPSVIILRQRNTHPQRLYEALARTEERWLEAVERGAIVIVEDDVLRIRMLPIGRP
jgi:predicted nuclease of predicted toxin-antitoxin system